MYAFSEMPAEATVPRCHTCYLFYRKSAPAEVWYDKVRHWACLQCHLTEKTLQKVKGKGTANRIFQRCGICECERSSTDANTALQSWWFCYSCTDFICDHCEASTHKDTGEVSHSTCLVNIV